ncbi:MAG TPA: cytochrome c peroxidase [Thermodesulfobacteriota bacterium]|nr:cytochrome c peroxidase [Thermodesulfobacteriota bacterium]
MERLIQEREEVILESYLKKFEAEACKTNNYHIQKKEKGDNMKKYILSIIIGTAFLLLSGLAAAPLASAQIKLTNIELLGKYVFFDEISRPDERMACVTCHQPNTGGTGADSKVNLHQVAITGANPHTVGNLKPPTNAYATLIGPFARDFSVFPSGYSGGNFWNGRAEGNEFPPEFPDGSTKHIGNEIFYTTKGKLIPGVEVYAAYFGAVADQALNPMPNPVEQNIPRKDVCKDVASAKYAPLYKLVWGVDINCSDDVVAIHAQDVLEERAFDISFKRLMLAVCAWQDSADLNSFSSKRDIALAKEPDKQFPLRGFTDKENLGHDLFYGKAGCTACHLSDKAHPDGTGQFERYSDNGFHNIGVPPNPEIPETFDAAGQFKDPDLGLFGHTGTIFVPLGVNNSLVPLDPKGMHKTATMRNVDKRPYKGFIKAYTHNGWFKSLESIVHFYNTAAMQEDLAPLGIPKLHDVTRCPDNITTEKDALANNCWPAPAYTNGTAIPFVIGNLGLTAEEEAAIVAYLKTLTDYYTPEEPPPYKPYKRPPCY